MEKAIFLKRYGFFHIGRPKMKHLTLALLILITATLLAGCGETVSGVGKDINRMGRGVSTFFFRQ
jgi:predicted small secreted protein